MNKYPLFILILLSLSGCKVGPNYSPPKTLTPIEFIENVPEKTFLIDDEDLVLWWKRFEDPLLEELIEVALENNYDYKIALERVLEARSQYAIQLASLLPELDLTAVGSRFRVSRSFGGNSDVTTNQPVAETTVSPIQNFYQLGLSALWEIDLFGKLRRSKDSAYDLWEASSEEMNQIKIILISDVANIYASICAYHMRLKVQNDLIDLDDDILSLAKSRFDAGLTNSQEVENAIANLEIDKSEYKITEAFFKQSIYSLATILGILPEKVMTEFNFNQEIPNITGQIPSSLPSDLLRRRSDIKSAERKLAASTENIGVAIAELFPSLTLSGSSSSFAANPLQGANVGYTSDTLNKLFKPASLIWGAGGFMTAPIFDFGKRSQNVDIRISERNQNYFYYKQTVIQALQETEIALSNYFKHEESLISLEKQTKANERLLNLSIDLYQSGLSNYTELLQVKETWLLSLNKTIDGKKNLMNDLIFVYRALGGNWE